VTVIEIRQAAVAEAPVLEELQRRFSDVWEQYRARFIENGWVRRSVLPSGGV
jgi:hypothetical protein